MLSVPIPHRGISQKKHSFWFVYFSQRNAPKSDKAEEFERCLRWRLALRSHSSEISFSFAIVGVTISHIVVRWSAGFTALQSFPAQPWLHWDFSEWGQREAETRRWCKWDASYQRQPSAWIFHNSTAFNLPSCPHKGDHDCQDVCQFVIMKIKLTN